MWPLSRDPWKDLTNSHTVANTVWGTNSDLHLLPGLKRRSFADVFNDCKKGAHVGERRITDEREFVRQLRNLIDRIRREAS